MSRFTHKRQSDKKNRLTTQRLFILDYLRNVAIHPPAEVIYEKVRKKLPTISLGTVYRNLNLLVKNNYILELHTANGKHHFDGNTKYHLHFICNHCATIYDIWEIKDILRQKMKLPGIIEKVECNLYGVCQKCLKKKGGDKYTQN